MNYGNQTIISLFKFPYATTIIKKYKASEKEKPVFRSEALIEPQSPGKSYTLS